MKTFLVHRPLSKIFLAHLPVGFTHRKRTMTEIREEGLTQTKELGIAWKSNGLKGKHVLKNPVNGKMVKKYKMKKMLGIKSGIRRLTKGVRRNCSPFLDLRSA